MRPFLLTLAVCLTGGIAHADFDYTFNVNASSPLDAFSFSFTVPTFVGNGATPAFTPFTVTDGTHSWTMTQDLVVPSLGEGCFMFGTVGTSLSSGCGFIVPNAPDGGLYLEASQLPTATGIYGLSGSSIFDFAGGAAGQEFPNLTGSWLSDHL
jgi:hypothetical protein